MSGPSKEQISTLRWLALTVLLAMFVSDYGFDAWAKPVPNYAYGINFAIALGIDIPTLRNLVIQFMKNMVKQNDQ